MNKNLIYSTILFVVGFTQIPNIFTVLILSFLRDLPVPDLLWLYTGRLVILLPFILSTYFAYRVLKEKATEGWKRILGALLLIGSILILLLSVATGLFWQEITKVNTGATTTELAERARDSDAMRNMALDSSRASTMLMADRFLADFYSRYGRYPKDVEEFESDWQAVNYNINNIEWDYYTSMEYHSSPDNQQYVLRIKMAATYLGVLDEVYDADGMPLEIDCSDEQLYYCHTESSPKRL
jgi:NADH:ubiquinone oxidoreductase subunit 6 (subunit J)